MWRGTITIPESGQYDATVDVRVTRGELREWRGVIKCDSATGWKLFSKGTMATDVGKLAITRVTEGRAEFEGSGMPEGELASYASSRM